MLGICIGRRRQGKSTLALALARAERNTTIVFDPNDQYGHLPIISNLADWMEKADAHSVGRIVPTEPVADFEEIVAELDGGGWKWGEYTLIVDECSMLMNPSKVHPALERYARTSPKDVSVILTTHRTVDVHTLFRSLATDWFFFNQQLDRDLETIEDNFGSEVAAASRNLPNYHVIHFWLDTGGTPRWEVWNKPEDWYIDIGRKT